MPGGQVTRPRVACRLAPNHRSMPRRTVCCSYMSDDAWRAGLTFPDAWTITKNIMMGNVSHKVTSDPAQPVTADPSSTAEALSNVSINRPDVPDVPPAIALPSDRCGPEDAQEATLRRGKEDMAIVQNSLHTIEGLKAQLKKWRKASQYDVPGQSYYRSGDLDWAKRHVIQWIADTTGCSPSHASHPAVDLEFLASTPSLSLLKAWCAQRRKVYSGLPPHSEIEQDPAAGLAKLQSIVQLKHTSSQAVNNNDVTVADQSVPELANAHLHARGTDRLNDPVHVNLSHIAARDEVLKAVAGGDNTSTAKRDIACVWNEITNLSQLTAFCKEKKYTLTTSHYRAADLLFAKWDVTHWIAERTQLTELCRTPQSDLAYLQCLRASPDADQSARLLKAWSRHAKQQHSSTYRGVPVDTESWLLTGWGHAALMAGTPGSHSTVK